MKPYSLLSTLLLLSSFHCATAEGIPVYLEPQTPDAFWKEIERKALAAANPQPLVYGNQTIPGWYWVRQSGTYDGYVRAADVTNNTVRKNAIVFLRPTSDSPALGTASAGTTVEVTGTGKDWVPVRYQGPVAYYFEDKSQVPSQEVTVVTSNVEIVTAGSNATETSEKIVIFEGGSISSVVEAEEYTGSTLPTLDELTIQPQRPPAPITRALSPEVARTYQGKLIRLNALARMTSGYEYALVGADGERIAYVNPNKALIFEPLPSFLDQDVVIQGKAQPGSTGALVLEADFMRRRH